MHCSRFLRPTVGAAALALFLGPAVATIELSKDDVDFRKNVYVKKKGEQMPYRLYVPLGYSPTKKYPLILWLHGGAGRGTDNVKQITNGNEKGAHIWTSNEVQTKFPTFVLAPQCPASENWSDPDFNQPSKALQTAMEILANVQKQFAIDPDRVYVVGQSMGGLGVWSLLQMHPDKWAGAIVLAAYDNFTNPQAISRVPLWVFQGDQDQTVPVSVVREMMKQLKNIHANVRYTEYHKVEHDVWNKAFAEPELIPWLSSQTRGQAGEGQVGSDTNPAPR
jgi:predicted peptidase